MPWFVLGLFVTMVSQPGGVQRPAAGRPGDLTEEAVLLLLEIHDGDFGTETAPRIDSDLVATALQTRLPGAHVLTQMGGARPAWHLVLTRQSPGDSVELRLDSPTGRPVAAEHVPLPPASPAATARLLALLAIGMLSPVLPGLQRQLPDADRLLPPPSEQGTSVGKRTAPWCGDLSLAAAWRYALPTLRAFAGLDLTGRLGCGAGFVAINLGVDLPALVDRRDDVELRVSTARTSLGAGGLLIAEPIRLWLAAGPALRRVSAQASGSRLALRTATYLDPGFFVGSGVELTLARVRVGASLTWTRFLWWERFTVDGMKIGNVGHSTVGGALYFGVPLEY